MAEVVKKEGDGAAPEKSTAQEGAEQQEQDTTVEKEGGEESTESTEESTEEEASDSEEGDGTSDGEDDAEKKPHEKTVPYERFQEVNDKLKEVQERLAKVEQGEKKRTWNDLSVPELRNAVKYFRGEKNEEMAERLEDLIVEKKAREVVGDSEGKRAFKEARVDAWADALERYPNLKNKESEHFKRTAALLRADPRYNQVPEGPAIAAEVAYARMSRERERTEKKKSTVIKNAADATLRKTGLEGGGRPGTSAASQSLDALEKAAVESKNPYGPEWRKYMRALESAKKKKE